jgi:hypothetical protein
MSGSFAVSSEASALKVLDYFNGFHDGFMKRMVIQSEDRIEEDLSQTCTGVFDVEIDFAHYNYPDGAAPFHPSGHIVRAQFHHVQDILIDLGGKFLGNTIIALSIAAASRRKGGETATEPCLGLRLARHYYLEEERRFELRETQLFTFTGATFVEAPGGA